MTNDLMYVDFCGVKLTITDDMDCHTTRVLTSKVDRINTEYQAILDYVRGNDIVLDVGAGSMACALVAASTGARVVAYEPSPRMVGVALANLDANRLLQVEPHFGWGLFDGYRPNFADLRLPAATLDEAAFDEACPADDGARATINRIEPIASVLSCIRPSVVIIETSGMACRLTRAVASAIDQLKPRVIIARLRASWEGQDQVHMTISVLTLMGYRIERPYFQADVLVFQRNGFDSSFS